MSFLLRSAKLGDVDQLLSLAKQFTLLNLPSSKEQLKRKVEISERSFSGEKGKGEAEYIFVAEDLERRQLVGSSLILAKHGTPTAPHHYFKVEKRDHYSQSLGLGFTHQVLTFKSEIDGPTEIGGLLVDRGYRRRPERLGRQISLVRFVYMGMERKRFEERVLCELSPPLTPDGRSEFWEALGRRFTGLPYQDADRLSQENSEFIRSLFPRGDIYLSLLDAKARIDLGQVAEETKPAEHLLKKLGFKYLHEVDPFDGGPHYGASLKNIKLAQGVRRLPIKYVHDGEFNREGFLAHVGTKGFEAVFTPFGLSESGVEAPERLRKSLGVLEGEEVTVSPLEF